MTLPGFKTSITTRTVIVEAATQLVFSELATRYERVPLGELASISSGGTPSRRNPAFYHGDIPWAKIADVTSAGKWIDSTEECISTEALENSTARLFPKGTVLFTMYGSIGKTAITLRPLATNQAILGLIPKPGLDSEYIYYALISARVALFLNAKGTSQMNINGRMVKAFAVPNPPPEIVDSVVKLLSAIEDGRDTSGLNLTGFLSEHRRIMSRIGEVVTKIRETRKLRQQAVEMTGVLWESCAERVFAELSEKGVRPLRELVIMRGGGTPSKADPFMWRGRVPLVCPKDMKSREITGATDHISEAATRNSPAKLLDPGSVLIVVRGMILAHTVPSAILMVPAAINQDMKALIPGPNLMPEFLCTALWALNRKILALVRKSTHGTRRLRTEDLLGFQVPLPPLEEQRSIITYLDDLSAKADELNRLQIKTSDELDGLLASVLPRSFKGGL